MSRITISELPLLYDIRQANNQALGISSTVEIKGGQKPLSVIEDVSKDLSNLLTSLGYTSLGEEAAKGPSRLKARLPNFLQLL